MHDIFLSHNSVDKPAVEALAHRLRAAGIDPWLDKWHLIPGNPWQQEIEQAIDTCLVCAIFIGPSGIGPWQDEEMRAAIDRRVSKGNFRVIPILLPGATRSKRSSLPTFLSATTWVEFRDTLDDEDAFHRFLAGIRGVSPGTISGGDGFTADECPYRGLQVFDVEHSPLFFGRQALTEWLLEAIRPEENKSNRFLAMLGASGSGKSSLARAGLLASLKQGKLKDSQHWPQIILKPGAKPLESLAIALCHKKITDKNQGELIGLFQRNDSQLHWLCRQALHGQPDDHRIVFLVDQFEEVFTLCNDDAEREAFINNLLTTATDVAGQAILLLTLRADFYSKCAIYPKLAAALSDDQFLISPMTEAELREAIEMPALQTGCEMEAGLVSILLNDVKNQPGSLPLLEYTLTLMWEKRRSRILSLADYQELGGLEGALNQRVDGIYNELPYPQKHICRRIFLRLVQIGEGTEHTRRRANLSDFGEDDETAAVVQKLANMRLITTQKTMGDGQAFAEVTHEALIRNWGQLREWIETDRESLKHRNKVTQAATEWQQNGEDTDWLLKGMRLGLAEEWLLGNTQNLSRLESRFLKKSQDARKQSLLIEKMELERQKTSLIRTRWLLGTMTTLALLMLIVSIFAMKWSGEAERNLLKANQSLAKVLEEKAKASFAKSSSKSISSLEKATHLRHAVMYTLEAVDLSPRTESFKIDPIVFGKFLQVNLSKITPRRFKIHTSENESIENISVSSNDEILAASFSGSNAIKTWRLKNGKLLNVFSGHKDSVNSIDFNHDTSLMVSGSDDKTIKIWDIYKKSVRLVLKGHEDRVNAVSFSKDGLFIVSGSADGQVKLWDAKSGRPLANFSGHDDAVNSVAFDISGSFVLSGSSDKLVKLWDIDKKSLVKTFFGHERSVSSVVFHKNGSQILSGSADETVRLWDVFSGDLIKKFEGHDRNVTSVAFNHDGSKVVSGSGAIGFKSGETINVWDVASGTLEKTISDDEFYVKSVLFSHDGRFVISASGPALFHSHDSISVWDYKDNEPSKILFGHADEIRSVVFNSSFEKIASASMDHKVKVWDVNNGSLITTLHGQSDYINSLSFTQDGSKIIFSSGSLDKFEDNSVKAWSFNEKGIVETLVSLDWPIKASAINFDDSILATGSDDGLVRLWDLNNIKNPPKVLSGHEEGINSVSFNNDESRLVSTSWDDTLRIWDTVTGELLHTLSDHWSEVNSAVYSNDGAHVASGSNDNMIILWNAHSGQKVKTFKGHKGGVNSVVFSEDDTRIASASDDDTIKIWDIKTGMCLYSFSGHNWNISSLKFSKNASKLVSAGGKTIKIWDISLLKYRPRELIDALGFLWETKINGSDIIPHSRKPVVAYNDRLYEQKPNTQRFVWNSTTDKFRPLLAPPSTKTSKIEQLKQWLNDTDKTRISDKSFWPSC